MRTQTAKILYLSVGWLALGLGMIGVFLPIMPTTPFLILAAFCFSRGSKRLHDWMLNQPLFGPPIKDWEEGGVIRKKAKLMATAMILPLFGYTFFFVKVAELIKWIIVAIGIAVLIFIWTRPSKLPAEKS